MFQPTASLPRVAAWWVDQFLLVLQNLQQRNSCNKFSGNSDFYSFREAHILSPATPPALLDLMQWPGLLGQARAACSCCHHLPRHCNFIHSHLLSTSFIGSLVKMEVEFVLFCYFLVKLLVPKYQGYVHWVKSGFLRKVSDK